MKRTTVQRARSGPPATTAAAVRSASAAAVPGCASRRTAAESACASADAAEDSVPSAAGAGECASAETARSRCSAARQQSAADFFRRFFSAGQLRSCAVRSRFGSVCPQRHQSRLRSLRRRHLFGRPQLSQVFDFLIISIHLI